MKEDLKLVPLTDDEIRAVIETLTTQQVRRENETLIYSAVVKFKLSLRDVGQKT